VQTDDRAAEHLNGKRLRDSLEWLLADERGRFLVREILEKTGLDHLTPQAFGDGAYGIGWWLRGAIQKHCPGQWLDMERSRLEAEAHRIGLEEERVRKQELELREESTP
jgi:hypothetical protein